MTSMKRPDDGGKAVGAMGKFLKANKAGQERRALQAGDTAAYATQPRNKDFRVNPVATDNARAAGKAMHDGSAPRPTEWQGISRAGRAAGQANAKKVRPYEGTKMPKGLLRGVDLRPDNGPAPKARPVAKKPLGYSG